MPDIRVVTASGAYEITVEEGLLESLHARPDLSALSGKSLFVLTDRTVAKRYGEKLAKQLLEVGAGAVYTYEIKPGERSKSWKELGKILSWMINSGVRRDSLLITFGGGVAGDIGGLAAALILRGIKYIQIPTTLMAQVDSAIGGKTAVNFPQAKNMAGAFHQPEAVLVDPALLKTLPDRDFRAGLAEIVKYAVIGDPEFFIWLERVHNDVMARKPDTLKKMVETCCRKKAETVSADERDEGQRLLLNFGHTFGHALEKIAGYDAGILLHGEAVSLGMMMAMRLSVRRGHCSERDADRVQALLQSFCLPVRVAEFQELRKSTAEDFLSVMKNDKKTVSDGLRFVLADGIGKAFVAGDVAENDVISAINESLKG